MAPQVYNVLTRQKEEFKPLHEGLVGMYVCGPTVYDNAHIGHAKVYVSFDVVNRYLRYLGYRVRYVQNITDVGHLTDNADAGEDKILRRATLERLQPMELVEKYMRSYFEDMDALSVLRPDISPRASAHIPEQIELMKTLLAKGHAYESNGSVYFDVSTWPEYGKLSGRKVEELQEGARVEVNPEKTDPADFALWKKAEPSHILKWNSPWGWGFPGWHAECTAMSTKYLGDTFDIHGGGLENIFPHNECELAQSEAATGQTFAHYWLLNNMVTINGVKMGKSLGNAVFLKDLFKRYPPTVIRYFILTSHYRSPADFSDDALGAAQSGLERLHNTVSTVRERLDKAAAPGEPSTGDVPVEMLTRHKTRFIELMDDDFNTAGAIAELFDLSKDVNTLLNSGETVSRESLAAIDGLYRELGGQILGIIPDQLAEKRGAGLDEPLMQVLLDTRAKLREAKQWALADSIRKQLSEIGVTIEDRPDGSVWKIEK
jgi:cysteinyl-tRNA synthetase